MLVSRFGFFGFHWAIAGAGALAALSLAACGSETGNSGASSGSGGGSASSSSTASSSGSGGQSSGSSSGSGGQSSGSGGAGGSAPSGGFADFVTKAMYEAWFPHRNALYEYDALVAATKLDAKFCNEGSMDHRKREAAAFLANIAHETTGGWPAAPDGPLSWGLYFTQEVGCENGGCVGYCDPNNAQYPCAPGKTYHGRGPIQLSWNYNYGQAGDALGLALLTDPDLVTSNGTVAFQTGIWFWVTPQAPKPSCHDVMAGNWVPSAQDTAMGRKPGFGMTINIINGGLECSMPTNAKVEDRVGFYLKFTQDLGVDPGADLYCDQMAHY